MTDELKLNRCSKCHNFPILWPAGSYPRPHYACPVCNIHECPPKGADPVKYWNKRQRSPLDVLDQVNKQLDQINKRIVKLTQRMDNFEGKQK